MYAVCLNNNKLFQFKLNERTKLKSQIIHWVILNAHLV